MSERSYAPTLSWYRGWVDNHLNVTVWIGVCSFFAVTLFGAELIHILTISPQLVVIGVAAAAFWSSSVFGLLLLFYSYGERQETVTN